MLERRLGDCDPQYYFLARRPTAHKKNIKKTNKEVDCFPHFVLDTVRRVIDNVYYYHPFVATGRYLDSIRNKPDPFGYHKRNSEKMPPTRMQKAIANSRGKRQGVVAMKRAMKIDGMRQSASSARRRSAFKYNGVTYYRGRRRQRGQFGKSTGFTKVGRIAKKYKRRTPLVFQGVTRVIETSGQVQDNEVVYLTHSVPLWQMKYVAWWALIKELFTRAGAFVQGFTDSQTLLACGSATGDVVRVVYKATNDAAVANLDFTGLNNV